MAWNGWGPSAADDIQGYDFLIQPWDAIKERLKALGNAQWPPTAIVWYTTTVTGVVDNGDGTLNISMDNTGNGWAISGACFPSNPKRWVNLVPTGSSGCNCPPCYLPVNYDLIIEIDADDQWKTIRGNIIDQSDSGTTGTLKIRGYDALNKVVAGFIPDLATLNGQKCAIIKQGGPWSADRLPEKPNDQELWIGNGTGGTGKFGTDLVTNYSTLSIKDTDPNSSWVQDQFEGLELLAFAGQLLKRIPIIHNDKDTLYFASGNSVAGTFSIVDVGAKGIPGREKWRPFQWYYGGNDVAAGHNADDILTTVNVAKTNEKWDEGDPCSIGGECKEYGHGVFDQDVQLPWDFEALCICGRAGDYVNPNLYKSFRQIQNVILDLCGSFVPMIDYGGQTAINNFTPATLFDFCGINNGNSTLNYIVTATDPEPTGYYSITFDSQYIGKNVWYTLFNEDGTVKSGGYGTVKADSTITDIANVGYNGTQPGDDGLHVVYSAGWTRKRPYWFKYFYPKTSFIPDPKPPLLGGGVYDPPAVGTDDKGHYDCGGRGTWIRKGKSTLGVVMSDDGGLYEAEALEAGKKYRCVGDNYPDPFPGGAIDGELTPYWNKYFRGKLRPDLVGQRNASKAGQVTSGTKISLTDSTKNWTGDGWANPGGSIRQESGTATAGGTTFLKDGTKDTTNPSLPHSCWWDDIRYFSNAYVGFTIEIDQMIAGQAVTFKAPITSSSHGATGIQVNFPATQVTVPGATPTDPPTVHQLTVAAGNAYRIIEPQYELNRWEGRQVVVHKKDGTTLAPIDITTNDKNTLFFPAQSTAFEAGDVYEIIEKGFGQVWTWNGSAFVIPPGDEAADQLRDEPSYKKDFGHIHKGDGIDLEILNEIYKTINALQWTQTNYSWSPDEDPATPEENYGGGAGIEQTDGPNHFATQADKDMASPPNYYFGPNLPVWSENSWNQNYSCNYNLYQCEGMREAMYDNGDGPEYIPYKSRVNQPPQKQFHHTGFMYGYHGTDPSGNYLNQPWMEVQVGPFWIDPAGASYAYGKVSGVPTLLTSSVELYVYSTIDPNDHDQGHFVTESGSPTSYYGKEYQDLTYTFDPGESGATFREWALYATVTVDSDGKATGPRFGETGDIDSLKGHFEGCPCADANDCNCHLVSEYPTVFSPPQGSKAQIEGMDHTGGSHYSWVKEEKRGYIVKKTAAIVKWDMSYVG